MNKTILSQGSLAFVNSLDLKKPLSDYPKWFQSTNTMKENDAVICALVQHFYPEIEKEVKCTVNSTIIHKWEIVVGRDEKNRMGDLRRSHKDQENRPCPVRKNPCKYIFLPEHVQLQVQTAFTIFKARREAEQKATNKQRKKETRSGAREPRPVSVSAVSRETATDARSKGKQREQAQISFYRDLPFADSEHAELIAAVQQIQNQELREMTERHSTEMDDLLTGHREQMAALLAQDLGTATPTVGEPSGTLPSPPPSSPFNYGSSSRARPSSISKQAQSILALTDLAVIEKMPPPKKRKADEEQETFVKRRKAGDVDPKAYEIIEVSSDEE
ncbi:hypothetical protein VKT23_012908 [Stygiomarasmius scandens]|uniref:Uncharacterized protein n=1 Tax=Marasmiellus scandens TaxID=2682957 RepID=A0ABR1J7B9_9AGAR